MQNDKIIITDPVDYAFKVMSIETTKVDEGIRYDVVLHFLGYSARMAAATIFPNTPSDEDLESFLKEACKNYVHSSLGRHFTRIKDAN